MANQKHKPLGFWKTVGAAGVGIVLFQIPIVVANFFWVRARAKRLQEQGPLEGG